jgi:hypothetical protein
VWLFEQHSGLVVKLVRTPTEEAFCKHRESSGGDNQRWFARSFSFSVAMTLSMRANATSGG